MSSPSSLFLSQEASTYDDISMEQNLLFSDSLKDLKTLRTQLYYAAEYFEVSYTNDDHKETVANTLKDYAVRAIVNTVDHLGCASDKVNGLFDEKADEVAATELRVSCIEQKIQTCQAHNDREGISQQSLAIMTPKYHKRYSLPAGESISGSTQTLARQQSFGLDEMRKITRDTPSSFRKLCSPSPSPQRGTFLVADKRTVSPVPTPRLFRSRSMSSRPTTPNSSNTQRSTTPNPSQIQRTATLNSCNTQRLCPSEPQKSASMRLFNEKEGQKGVDQYPSISKRLLKALLTRNKSKNDPMMYSYLDEY
ncbi:hypothetical protein MRB53_002576 [Persea americana]|uniref:Uncharacterized protein n=1 Tax=Persea americana TaxID=3435 RepID=A0ACC2MV90_PERAE|nr:hypothetical protein MRB53_002576 [Persea americana]